MQERKQAMFKLKYEACILDAIFRQNHIDHAMEDYYQRNKENNAFCVADGITRDPMDGIITSYPMNKEEALALSKRYPNPSGAWEASKICADRFVEYISEVPIEEVTPHKIKEITRKVNEQIWEINKDREIDYLTEDLYCCEAVGGIIVADTLYAFSLGDCHITLLDKDYHVIYTTINNHKNHEEYFEKIYQKEHTFDWTNPEDRKLVRQQFRNKPNKKYQGKDISYGAFSGEEEANYYIDTYQIPLGNVSYVCVYSDGCEPDFATAEEIKKTIENPDRIKEKGHEKTLLIFAKE